MHAGCPIDVGGIANFLLQVELRSGITHDVHDVKMPTTRGDSQEVSADSTASIGGRKRPARETRSDRYFPELLVFVDRPCDKIRSAFIAELTRKVEYTNRLYADPRTP